MKYLIKNGLIPSNAPEFAFFEADLIIDGDIIAFIGNGKSLDDSDEKEIIDASGCLVLPGFVNAHLHSHDHFNKGGFDNLPLEVWMTLLRPFYTGISATKDEIYLRTLLGCIEMLKTGTTTIIDDIVQTPFNNEDKLDAIFSAYNKAGIRAFFTSHIGNKPIEKTIPFLQEAFNKFGYENKNIFPFKEDEIIDYVKKMLKKYKEKNTIQKYAVAPSAPQRCTPELLQSLTSIAKEYAVPAVIHTLETYTQKTTGQVFYGQSLVSYLDDIEALNEYVNLIHCVWVNDKDVEIMKNNKVRVVHNPTSNLKLGSGIAPIRKFLDAGIPVGLGTDNTSSNDTINLFLEMKMAALINKVTTKDYRKWIGAQDAFYMATIGGAKCANIENEIGSVEVGKKADLSIVSIENERFTPINNLINHIVFAENGSSVRDVFINGKCVVKNRRIMTFDEREVILEVKKILPKIQEEQKLAFAEADGILQCLEQAYFRANESR